MSGKSAEIRAAVFPSWGGRGWARGGGSVSAGYEVHKKIQAPFSVDHFTPGSVSRILVQGGSRENWKDLTLPKCDN